MHGFISFSTSFKLMRTGKRLCALGYVQPVGEAFSFSEIFGSLEFLTNSISAQMAEPEPGE